MVKRVLMIAFHYPPMVGSSSIQRTLKFAQYLPRHGWQPLVLTAHPRAYLATGDDQLDTGSVVHRSFALDAGRDLAIRGRYPGWLALPDRWVSWWCSAVPAALRLIRRYRPQLIWSTYPIATAHLIGLTVQRLSGLGWVADQRDPMIDAGYPADPRTRRLHGWIEAQAARRSARVVCTTAGALRAYRQRFPEIAPERFALVENGYDEIDFTQAAAPQRHDDRFTLLHSGAIYPSERDPTALFHALAVLKRNGHIDSGRFRLLLRATGHDSLLRQLIDTHGIGDIVELAPALPYRAALGEMQTADALLLLQGSSCNDQIPAKVYEYLRAGRPVLALTDPRGDTAATLSSCGGGAVAALDDPHAIAAAMRRCLARTIAVAPVRAIVRHSRAARAGELANLFDQLTEAS